jgi:hypothetical protein
LKNKITGRGSQGACRQDELIGGKQPVVNNSDSEEEAAGSEPPFREDLSMETEEQLLEAVTR